MALKLQVVRTPQCSQLLQGKPVAPSGPSCELTPCRKAPKPAGRAAAAPPSLRGRGSPARRASPEGAGRAAGPRQARHAGPPRSGDSRQPEAGGRRCGERLRGSGRWGGSRQHRGRQGQPAGNFPPTIELVQDPYCRRSRSGRRRCRRRCPFLPFPVFWGSLRRWGGSWEAQAKLGVWGVATIPGRSQSRCPLGVSLAASAPGATSPTSRRPPACAPSLCRRLGSSRQPAVPSSGAGQHSVLAAALPVTVSFVAGPLKSRVPAPFHPLWALARRPSLSALFLLSLPCCFSRRNNCCFCCLCRDGAGFFFFSDLISFF